MAKQVIINYKPLSDDPGSSTCCGYLDKQECHTARWPLIPLHYPHSQHSFG